MTYPYGFETGRFVAEDGSVFNLSNYLQGLSKACVSCNIFNGKMHSATHRFTIPGESTYYIAAIVPEGTKVFILSRQLSLSEGEYNIDVIEADFDDESGAPMTLYPLNQASDVTLEASFRAGVGSVTNEEVLEYGYVDAGNIQGPAKPSAVLASDQIFKILTKNTLLKIEKLDSGSVTSNATIIFWEVNGT